MKTYGCTLESRVEIIFNDLEKAKSVFLSNDYSQVYFDFVDMDEVAKHLSTIFHTTASRWFQEHRRLGKYLEGFGDFIYNPWSKAWILVMNDAIERGSNGISIKVIDEIDCVNVEEK